MRIYKIANEEEDYKGEHEAPTPESGAPMNDLSGMFPEDIYSGNAAKMYGHGMGSVDAESLDVIHSAKGRPHQKIKVYRAVPALNIDLNSKIKELSDLTSYYNQFGFFPTGNEFIWDMKEKHGNKTGHEHREMMKDIYDDLIQQENELRSQKKPEIKINIGDWVTPSLGYAKDHGITTLGKYRIITKTVIASQLYTDGDIHEWGYYP
jgi:hypothetical protein